MIIEIDEPIFKCEEDENIFFTRVHEISGYKKLIINGSTLFLTINESSKEIALQELQEVCNIWHTSFNVVEN